MEIIIHDSTAESAEIATFAVKAGYATEAATALYANEAGYAEEADTVKLASHAHLANEAIWSDCCNDTTGITYYSKRSAQYKGWYGSGGLMPMDRLAIPAADGGTSSYSYLDALNYIWTGGSGSYHTRCSVVSDVATTVPPSKYEKVNTTPMTSNSSPGALRAEAIAQRTSQEDSHTPYAAQNDYGNEAYTCFDGKSSTYWKPVNRNYIFYKIMIDLVAQVTIDKVYIMCTGSLPTTGMKLKFCNLSGNTRTLPFPVETWLETSLEDSTYDQFWGYGYMVNQSDWGSNSSITLKTINPGASRYWCLMLCYFVSPAEDFGIREIKFFKKRTELVSVDGESDVNYWHYTFNGAQTGSFTYPSLIGDINLLKTKTFDLYSIGRLKLNTTSKLYYYSGALGDGSPLVTTTTPRYGTSDFYWNCSDAGTQISEDDVPEEVFARGIEDVEHIFQYKIANNLTNEIMKKYATELLNIYASSKYNKVGQCCEIQADQIEQNMSWIINGIAYPCKENKLKLTSNRPVKLRIGLLDPTCKKHYNEVEIFFI